MEMIETWLVISVHKHLFLNCAGPRMLLNPLYMLGTMCQETSLRILLVGLQIIRKQSEAKRATATKELGRSDNNTFHVFIVGGYGSFKWR